MVFWTDPDAAAGCVSLQCEDGSERTFVAADRLAPAVDPDAPPGLPDELAAAKRKLAAASYGAAGQDPRHERDGDLQGRRIGAGRVNRDHLVVRVEHGAAGA